MSFIFLFILASYFLSFRLGVFLSLTLCTVILSVINCNIYTDNQCTTEEWSELYEFNSDKDSSKSSTSD